MNKLLALLALPAVCAFGNLTASNSFTPEESQGWRTSHSPDMSFQTEFTSEGLSFTFQGIPNSPNYMALSTEVGWDAGAKGLIEITLRAAEKRGIYFAVELLSADGVKYRAIASGDPKRGYVIDTEPTVAELPFSLFVDEGQNRLPENTPIARISLIFAAEPGISNTITINKVSIVNRGN
jgi:hypothetical protein